MHQRTEQEIMRSWKGVATQPVVSICCTTYNHENYISDAIEGFLRQETDFPFEILIRDDCSTDNTTNIIKHFTARYPQLIKPVYEKENTFSRGVKPLPELYKIAKGKYIAICEGDDYWTDPLKLQQQLDEMKKHPDIGISFHLCSNLDHHGILTKPALQKGNRIYSTEEIIKGDFHLVQTNTILFKTRQLDHLNLALLSNSPVGDVWLRIATSIPNGALFINRNMSVYRVQSAGSWSETIKRNNKFLDFVTKMLVSIDEFDKYWEYKYNKELKYYKNRYITIVIKNNSIPIKDKYELLSFHKSSISSMNFLIWHVMYKHQKTIQIFRNIKNRLLRLMFL